VVIEFLLIALLAHNLKCNPGLFTRD